MTTVSAASSATAAAASVAATKTDADKATIDYNAFLQLLVAQLKNQDPLNPSDPTQQLSQLASFSNVEQSIKANEKLSSLLTASSLAQADGVIGRTLTSADGAVSGVVRGVSITDKGAVATLSDGKTIDLGAGIKVE